MGLKRFLWLISLLMPLLWSCSDDKDPIVQPTPYTEIDLGDTRSVTDINNEFAFKVFNMNSETINPVVSPFSLFTTMAMLANGDSGEARDEMLGILGYGEKDTERLNTYCRIMKESLPTVDGQTIVRLNNSLWHTGSLVINPDYKLLLSEVFGAESFNRCIDTPEGVDKLNRWVSTNTMGMIPNFIKKPMYYDALLVNTVYFNGQWKDKFKASDTANDTFRCADGTVSSIPFMNRTAARFYFNDGKREGVELKYGNGNFSMIAIRNLDSSIPEMTARELKEFLSTGDPYMVSLSIPKFEALGDYSWNPEGLGILKGTDPGYNNILKDGYLPINKLFHAVSIKVSEEGTVAAAATGAGMASSPGYEMINIKFNSPFLYLIRETSTNTILFMGRQDKF